MKTKSHLYFGTFLILVSGYAIVAASQWSFKAGFFPLAVAIPLLVLTLVHLGLECFGPAEARRGPAVDAEFTDEVAPELARRRVIELFSWMAAFILSVYLLGFPLTVPLFLLSFLKLQSRVSWVNALLLTFITWGLFHGLFERLVHIQFESGVVQTWLGV
jgi:hypothetical protein